MIKNPELLQELDQKYKRENPLTHKEKLAIFNAIYSEALKSEAIKKPEPPMYGIKHIIEMKRKLNCLKKS